MESQKSKAHDLFLLMFNLSQITLKETIIDVFVEALREIWPDIIVSFEQINSDKEKVYFEISINNSNYGYLRIENIRSLKNNDLDLLHNAVSMLSLVLKKNDQDKLLSDERFHLQRLVDEKTEVIKESENLYKTLVKHLPQKIFIKDKESTYIACNDNYAVDFGIAPVDMIGKNDFDFYPPDLANAYRADDQEVIKQGKAKDIEEKYLQNGEERWIHTIKVPYTDTKNKIIGVLGVFEDITERKHAEKALKESEDKFRKAFKTSPDSISLNRLSDGAFLEINEGFEKILGYSQDKVIGKTSLELNIWKNLKERKKLVTGLDEKGYAENLEAEFLSNKGEVIFGSMSATIIETNNEKAILSITRDITERKKAEEALLQSEATIRNKLKAILEPEGDISTLELSDIIDAGVLESMMEDFYQITGMLGAVLDIAGNVLVAVGWQDICTKFHRCHPDTLKNCIESDTILSNGVPTGIFKAYHCKNNMWDMVTPIMIGDRHVGNVFVGQFFYDDEIPDVELFRKQAQKFGFDETKYLAALDKVPRFSKEVLNAGMQFYAKFAGIISTLSYSSIKQSRMLAEHKLAEEEIQKLNEELELRVKQRTTQLEDVVKELETFTYSVSHDLKAPLRGIDGYSKLLLDLYGGSLNEEAKSFLSTIRNSTSQMNQLIVDLLEYSRLERSQMRKEKIKIVDIVNVNLSSYNVELNSGNFKFKVNIPDIEIVADSKGLTIALRNLIENAIKFTKGKPEPVIEIGCEEKNTSYVISIKDNGIGFDMKYHQKIFEIFQRLHRIEDFAGTGIGLAMVSKAMQRMNGKVWAESTPGIGSIFYLELPKIN